MQSQTNNAQNTQLPSPSVTPELLSQDESIILPFTARFEIYTLGTKRTFSESMYHLQSADAYIEKSNPELVYVTKEGVTWDAFFKSLPFTLTKECLITGTNQTFCSNQTKKLKFILNDSMTPNLLDLPIQKNDTVQILYE